MHGTSENEGQAWGKGEFANMPQSQQMKGYPKANQFGPGNLDDTMTGIDKSNSSAASKTRSNLSNQH